MVVSQTTLFYRFLRKTKNSTLKAIHKKANDLLIKDGFVSLDEFILDSKLVDFKAQQARIALMPGSRAAELESLWKPMQQVALRLKEKYPALTFVTVALDNEREQLLRQTQIPGFDCQYTVGSVSNTASAVDFTIVTSGSATLEPRSILR